MQSLDTVFRDIRRIIKTVVIKYDNKAKKGDTLDIIKAYDLYCLALDGRDTFGTYKYFDKRIFEIMGLSKDLVESYYNDKNNIPVKLRDTVLRYQRQLTILEFDEKNNYYRELLGLPDIGDEDFVFLDIETADELDIEISTPLHKLTSDEVNRLNHFGKLSIIIAENPSKGYLNFLGDNSIDIRKARTAKNMAILRMSSDLTENFYNEFNLIYSQVREYYMSVMYVKDFSTRYSHYDSFIGLMIMTMTIQKTFVNIFKYGIEKDFYDLGSIKMLFDSYNVPFIEDLPIDYQRVLMKNLNRLLQYKASDRVLYDICSILGFDRINIFKYFLSKEHNKDSLGKPIFLYKNITNPETGEVETVFDYEKMFTFKWKSVDLKEQNVPMAMLENTNINSYESVIVEDPYWVDDSDLRTRLYESEFNYIESKYLKMNIMYNMTEVLFENIYAMRIISDNRNTTSKIMLKLPKLFGNKDIKLFNIIILLSALLCKKNKLKGNIIDTGSKTLSVLGYNFKANIGYLKDLLKDNRLIIDESISDKIKSFDILSAYDINVIYRHVKELHGILIDKMNSAKTIEAYDIYKKLYDALMITEYNNEIYKMSTGEIAPTYKELLQDIDVDLYAFISTIEGADIDTAIEHILIQLNEKVVELEHTYYLNSSSSIVLNALIKLIGFFKSYTTDLTSFNILYVMDNPYLNRIRMISQIDSIVKSFYPFKTDLIPFDKFEVDKHSLDSDTQIMRDLIYDIYTHVMHKETNELVDTLSYDKYEELRMFLYKPFNDLISMSESSYVVNDKNIMRDTIKILD